MAVHEADLTGRTLDVLRHACGFEGGESFPVPITEFCTKNKKEIHFFGAVGEIALLDNLYSTVPPNKAGLVLHFSYVLWRELQLNDCNRAQYAKLQRAKGDLCLCGPFWECSISYTFIEAKATCTFPKKHKGNVRRDFKRQCIFHS